MLGNISVLSPTTEPERFIIFISDADGLTAKLYSQAEMLVARGAAVALVDINVVKASLLKRTEDDCYWTFDDFDDMAHMAQRQLGMSNWHWPVLLGFGEGATLAYLTVSQAPVNTAGGAVSVRFSATFPMVKPICPGSPADTKSNQSVTYAPRSDMTSPWTLITAAALPPSIKAFIDVGAQTRVVTSGSDVDAQFSAAIDAALAMKAPTAQGLSDLPLTELPGKGNPRAMVILISGDGGWRDIDKEIGEYLAEHGVSVIGLDTMRYFWSRKEPAEIAADLDRIAEHYLEKWNLPLLSFAGYSFGADVIPLAWPKLNRKTQDRTALISLLGIEPTADLEISVSDWLGLKSDYDIDIRPYLAALPKSKVLCFYGTDESADDNTACVFPELDGAARIERPGGHHFDGNYQAIADTILQRLVVK